MRLFLKNISKHPSSSASFDYNARRQAQARVARNLHPDRLFETMHSEETDNIIFYDAVDFYNTLRSFNELVDWFDAELEYLKGILCALDSIFIYGPDDLESCNRRRHLICQVVVHWCETLKCILRSALYENFDYCSLSCDIATLAAHLLKHLQKNYEQCCIDSERLTSDHQNSVKLLIEITYTCVPILQDFLLSGFKKF